MSDPSYWLPSINRAICRAFSAKRWRYTTGTDVTGTVAVPNDVFGVSLSFAQNKLGGAAPGEGNVISDNNGTGVEIVGSNSTNDLSNEIRGNFIGTDPTGTLALGNADCGVLLRNRANGNTIGGAAPGAGNIVAFNGLDGVRVDSGNRNRISRNSVFSNPASESSERTMPITDRTRRRWPRPP